MKKMCNNKILSQSLLDWSLHSTTEFLEEGSDKELEKLAKEKGILIPSPDISLFKTIYAKIGEVNRNGVILEKLAVEKGLPTLIGKQINFDHIGTHMVCGYILDAKIEGEYIVIYGTIFKSLFAEEFQQVKDLFAEHKLSVSFEIYNRDEKGNSVVHLLENGQRSIDPIIFHGCGLLLNHDPACKESYVSKLLASAEADAIKFQMQKQTEQDKIFVYANLVKEEPICTKCKTCTCEKEVNNIMAEEILIEVEESEFALLEEDYVGGEEIEEAKKLKYQDRQNLPDSDFAVVITVKNKVTGEPRKIRMFPIQDEAHVRNALARLPQAAETLKKLGISQEEVLKKILKRAKELNMTELLKRYEKAEEKVEEVIVEEKPAEIKAEEVKIEEPKIEEPKAEETQVTPEPAQVTEPAPIVEQKPEEQAQVVEQPVEVRKVISVIREEVSTITDTDGKCERKGNRKVTTKFDDGTEEINTEEYQVVDTYSVAEVEAKVAEAKAEKEIEIINLKKELDSKNQEIAELTKPKVEVAKIEEKPELDVGTVEKIKDDKYKVLHDKVDERAFGKKKDKK